MALWKHFYHRHWLLTHMTGMKSTRFSGSLPDWSRWQRQTKTHHRLVPAQQTQGCGVNRLQERKRDGQRMFLFQDYVEEIQQKRGETNSPQTWCGICPAIPSNDFYKSMGSHVRLTLKLFSSATEVMEQWCETLTIHDHISALIAAPTHGATTVGHLGYIKWTQMWNKWQPEQKKLKF